MGIKTLSQFLYGHEVDVNEHYISIDEGSGEISVSLTPSGYTFLELGNELARALNVSGALDYTVAVDRTTRKYTVSATGAFDILISSGDYAGSSLYATLGFNAVDKTGLATYASDFASGVLYRPQLKFFDYSPSDYNEASVQVSINQSGDGQVEIINFGTVNYMECSIKYITNRSDRPEIIELNLTAVEEALSFLRYIRRKNRIEFMPNRDDPGEFEKLIIEKTEKSSNGTEVKLYEMTSQNIQEYFETRLLVFRKVV